MKCNYIICFVLFILHNNVLFCDIVVTFVDFVCIGLSLLLQLSGELVPDSIMVPLVMERLQVQKYTQTPCACYFVDI